MLAPACGIEKHESERVNKEKQTHGKNEGAKNSNIFPFVFLREPHPLCDFLVYFLPQSICEYPWCHLFPFHSQFN
jgi:hypothetical protein